MNDNIDYANILEEPAARNVRALLNTDGLMGELAFKNKAMRLISELSDFRKLIQAPVPKPYDQREIAEFISNYKKMGMLTQLADKLLFYADPKVICDHPIPEDSLPKAPEWQALHTEIIQTLLKTAREMNSAAIGIMSGKRDAFSENMHGSATAVKTSAQAISEKISLCGTLFEQESNRIAKEVESSPEDRRLKVVLDYLHNETLPELARLNARISEQVDAIVEAAESARVAPIDMGDGPVDPTAAEPGEPLVSSSRVESVIPLSRLRVPTTAQPAKGSWSAAVTTFPGVDRFKD